MPPRAEADSIDNPCRRPPGNAFERRSWRWASVTPARSPARCHAVSYAVLGVRLPFKLWITVSPLILPNVHATRARPSIRQIGEVDRARDHRAAWILAADFAEQCAFANPQAFVVGEQARALRLCKLFSHRGLLDHVSNELEALL